ncbi:MAG: glycosyltransferase [Deltaproteobacteria bacterium CG_4_8_14_3_um_filter_45_9]|nr:MAG: glycosyltransferase [Deltaproteobacteria bacterium CG03_land_8_20_14_0_80_45_14]PIX24265.1 MAG: glycosyltransferase [Deltaproteobacteria bacterium CG_4_8_14_3_um_filter_45_9]
MDNSKEIEISVVAPVYNEEGNLPFLIPKLAEVLRGLGRSYEMIFVDDGSSDGSRRILKEMASQYPFIRILRLKENRGLSTALMAGMREARGEKIVTLDSDLQNDPADIPRLLEYLDRYDMATGWRRKREDTWLKKISSKIGNGVRNWLSGENIQDSACTLRAFKKECIQEIPVFNGMHRFLSTLVKMKGYRIVEVPVSHHPRKSGKSKYNIRNRMVRSFIDLLAVRWMKRRALHYEIEERI